MRKTILVLGAVVVALFMVSAVSATEVVNTQPINEQINANEQNNTGGEPLGWGWTPEQIITYYLKSKPLKYGDIFYDYMAYDFGPEYYEPKNPTISGLLKNEYDVQLVKDKIGTWLDSTLIQNILENIGELFNEKLDKYNCPDDSSKEDQWLANLPLENRKDIMNSLADELMKDGGLEDKIYDLIFVNKLSNGKNINSTLCENSKIINIQKEIRSRVQDRDRTPDSDETSGTVVLGTTTQATATQVTSTQATATQQTTGAQATATQQTTGAQATATQSTGIQVTATQSIAVPINNAPMQQDRGDLYDWFLVKMLTVFLFCMHIFYGHSPVLEGLTLLVLYWIIGFSVARNDCCDKEQALIVFAGMLIVPWVGLYYLLQIIGGHGILTGIIIAACVIGIIFTGWFWLGLGFISYIFTMLMTFDKAEWLEKQEAIIGDALDRADYWFHEIFPWWPLFPPHSYTMEETAVSGTTTVTTITGSKSQTTLR